MKLFAPYETLGRNNVQVTMAEPDYDGESWSEVRGYWEQKDAEMRGEALASPRTMKVAQGQNLRDYLLCDLPYMYFVSKRAKEVFEAHGVTGVSFIEYPFERPEGGLTEIYRLAIIGRTKKIEPRPATSRKWDIDGYIDPAWWDGSDFSVTERPNRSVILSPRVPQIIRKEKLKIVTKPSYYTDRAEYLSALA